MCRKQLLLLIALFVSSALFAQNDNEQDGVQVSKYTVKLIINNDSTYGYAIYDNNLLRVRQPAKAYLPIPRGFVKKENAWLVGKWEATQLDVSKAEAEKLDLKKAESLGVTSEDLDNN